MKQTNNNKKGKEAIIDINKELKAANKREKKIKMKKVIINKREEIILVMDEQKNSSIYTCRLTYANGFGDIRSLSYKTSNGHAQMSVPTTTSQKINRPSALYNITMRYS
jgi:hypothetical protein